MYLLALRGKEVDVVRDHKIGLSSGIWHGRVCNENCVVKRFHSQPRRVFKKALCGLQDMVDEIRVLSEKWGMRDIHRSQ